MIREGQQADLAAGGGNADIEYVRMMPMNRGRLDAPEERAARRLGRETTPAGSVSLFQMAMEGASRRSMSLSPTATTRRHIVHLRAAGGFFLGPVPRARHRNPDEQAGRPFARANRQVQPGGTGEQQCKCAKMYFLWDLLRLSVDFNRKALGGMLSLGQAHASS